MSTELDRYAPMGNVAEPGTVARWAAVLIPAAQLAERIAGTEFVPAAMRGKPDVVVAAIMYGDEIGIGPMQALASIHVVDGRPAPSAELMRAMILRAGHSFDVHESTGQRVRVSGLRAGHPESERRYVDWTTDMARAAGLLSKQNWQRYPRAMLLARATGDLARQIFPDVVKGLGYVAEDQPEELESWAPDSGEPEPVRPSRKAVQRRTRPKSPDPVQDPPAALDRVTEGAGERPESPPVTPRPPAPTRVERVDRPIPELRKLPDDRHDPPPPSEAHQGNDRREAPLRHYEDRPLPEPGDPEPGPVEVAPATIGSAQLRALHTKLGHVLGPVERHEKLAWVGAVLGRPIETTATLPRADGFKVLDFLAACEAGEATWAIDDDGEVYVSDLRRPPDPDPPESAR